MFESPLDTTHCLYVVNNFAYCNVSSHLPGIERVKQATLLGIDATDTLSTAAYVNSLCRLISVCISYPFFIFDIDIWHADIS